MLKRLMADAQSKDAHFMVFDRSEGSNGHAPLPEELKRRLSHVDVVIVLCGHWTHMAPNVTAELRLARELKKRCYFVKGRTFGDCAMPSNARLTDKMFKWTRGTVDRLVLRNV